MTEVQIRRLAARIVELRTVRAPEPRTTKTKNREYLYARRSDVGRQLAVELSGSELCGVREALHHYAD